MNRDELFAKIKSSCKDDLEYFYEILKFRGFLLEESAGKMYISDNSHIDDIRYLSNIVQGFAQIKDCEIVVYDRIDFRKLEDLFSPSVQVSFPVVTLQRGWCYFKNRTFGDKVPVEFLEPFVARYVKALSACGVLTSGSCDGNHTNNTRLYLQFMDSPSEFWHELLCRYMLKQFNIPWSRSSYSLVSFSKTDRYDIYYKINKAAEFLYNNRVLIRKIKQEALSSFASNYLKKSPSEKIEMELENVVKKLAVKYFDKIAEDV